MVIAVCSGSIGECRKLGMGTLDLNIGDNIKLQQELKCLINLFWQMLL